VVVSACYQFKGKCFFLESTELSHLNRIPNVLAHTSKRNLPTPPPPHPPQPHPPPPARRAPRTTPRPPLFSSPLKAGKRASGSSQRGKSAISELYELVVQLPAVVGVYIAVLFVFRGRTWREIGAKTRMVAIILPKPGFRSNAGECVEW